MRPTGKQAIVIGGSVRGECDHALASQVLEVFPFGLAIGPIKHKAKLDICPARCTVQTGQSCGQVDE